LKRRITRKVCRHTLKRKATKRSEISLRTLSRRLSVIHIIV
jgi:hypothetical protein